MSYKYAPGMGTTNGNGASSVPSGPPPYEVQVAQRQAALADGPAPRTVGTDCDLFGKPGVIGKFYFPIPQTETEIEQAQASIQNLMETEGCFPGGAMFDMDNMEVCCPPGVVVPGPPAPPPEIVINGAPMTNGNGAPAAAAPAEEKKYLGFTTTELMLGAAGGLVLIMLLKR